MHIFHKSYSTSSFPDAVLKLVHCSHAQWSIFSFISSPALVHPTPRFCSGALNSAWIAGERKANPPYIQSRTKNVLGYVLFGSVILSLFIFYRKNNYFIFVENSIKNESCPFQTNQSSIKLIFQINLILYSFRFFIFIIPPGNAKGL